MKNNNIKPKELIKKRDFLVKEIKSNWTKLYIYNTDEVQGVDRLGIYNEIVVDSLELVKIKLAIQAINMGLTKLVDLAKNNIYGSIFLLQQKKELKTKLSLLPTNEKSVISKDIIAKTINSLNTEIKELLNIIDEYNNTVTFEM